MTTILYNCKRCKVGRRVDYPLGSSRNYRKAANGVEYLAGIWINACGGGRPTVYGGDTEMGLCPSCHKMMSYEPLKATINPDHKCSGICMGARGGSCDCSCGGANHGRSWAA